MKAKHISKTALAAIGKAALVLGLGFAAGG